MLGFETFFVFVAGVGELGHNIFSQGIEGPLHVHIKQLSGLCPT